MKKRLIAMVAAVLLLLGVAVPAYAGGGTWVYHNTRSNAAMYVQDAYGRKFYIAEGTSASNITYIYAPSGCYVHLRYSSWPHGIAGSWKGPVWHYAPRLWNSHPHYTINC